MKKVLIITYYWPPAGGPGVQRWLKFVKYLRDFQIEPVVFVPENPSYPIIDESFKSEIPEDLRVIKQPIFEPYSLAGIFSKKETETISSGIIAKEKNQSALQKAMLYIRGNYFIPDARKFWIKPSVKFLKEELQKNNYDALITTGPPHSLHLIGLGLSEKTNIKWIADFRDPWTNIGYHSKLKLSKRSQEKHEKLERKVLHSANHIITTSFTTKREFDSKTSQPVSVITNGFDLDISETIKRPQKFQISHVGSLLSGRNPSGLWKVLGELIEENEDFRNEFHLKLAGRISEEVLKSIKDQGLNDYLEIAGYVDHESAIAIQKESAVLLLIEIDSEETRGIIPGKLFEYLAVRRPLIAVGPEGWDVEQIINETKAGKVFSYNDSEKIKNEILSIFRKYQKGEKLINSAEIYQYHRKELTGKLAKLISNI